MRYEARTEAVEDARAGEEGPEIWSLVQKKLCSLTHGRVCGDPISHVPGGTHRFWHKSGHLFLGRKKQIETRQQNDFICPSTLGNYTFYYEPLIQVECILCVPVMLLLVGCRFLGLHLFTKSPGFSCCVSFLGR